MKTLTRTKEYMAEAQKRSRARKKKALDNTPRLRQVLAICMLVETRGCSIEQACRHVLRESVDVNISDPVSIPT